MKKEEKKGIKLSKVSERLVKEYCARHNITVEEFIDEAIIEKLEMEELRAESGETDTEFQEPFAENYISDEIEEDEYKKKH